MNQYDLRNLLRPQVISLYNRNTADHFSEICEKLGLPPLATEGTKQQRVTAWFETLPDPELESVAELFLRYCGPSADIKKQDRGRLLGTEGIFGNTKKHTARRRSSYRLPSTISDHRAFNAFLE